MDMRTFIIGLSILSSAAVACSSSDGPPGDPPVLKVISPERGTIQSGLADVEVRGIVTPAPDYGDGPGLPIQEVEVNGVPAQVAADGSFTALVPIGAGATMLKTIAKDTGGNEATDTRTLAAGNLLPLDSIINDGVTAAISDEAFAKLAEMAGTLIKQQDLGAMVQVMNPVVNSGDGPDCLYAQAWIRDLDMSNAQLRLTPYSGGLRLWAQIDDLDVPVDTNYAVACLDGDTAARITADRVTIEGNLAIGLVNGEVDVQLVDPTVDVDDLDIDADGIPGAIIDMLALDNLVGWVVPYAVDLFIGPMINDAIVGGIAQVEPVTVDILGHSLTTWMKPSAIAFDPAGGKITLDSRFTMAGSEASPGLIYTENGVPSMDAGNGFQIAMADDAINQLANGFWAVGAMNLTIPHKAGQFDTLKTEARLPPMMSASSADGDMKMIVGDMIVTLVAEGVEEAKLAFNAEISMSMDSEGNIMKLSLDPPVVNIDVTDEIPNTTNLSDEDLETIHHAVIGHMMDTLLPLVGAVPLPSFAGARLVDVDINGRNGYVTVSGALD
jgi:hypothetical protein